MKLHGMSLCLLPAALMGTSGCALEAVEEEAVGTDERALVAPFVIGFQLADDGGQGGFGQVVWTPYAAPATRIIWLSNWATDSNRYDPDAGRVFLDIAPGTQIRDTDFRLAYRVADDGWSKVGEVQYTGWASEGGLDPFAQYAVDTNAYDFDSVMIGIETKQEPGLVIRDFRIGVQFADDGGMSQEGAVQFTGWASRGGGVSPWAMDANGYDPDGMRLVLEARP